MFESIFGGDLNGQCIYDVDWDNYPECGGRGSVDSGATIIGKFGPETSKAILYDFFGRNRMTGKLERATRQWLSKSWARNSPPPKNLREFMDDEFVFVKVPSWLFNKVKWPKTHDFQFNVAIEKQIKLWTPLK